MISVEKAQRIIEQYSKTGKTHNRPLSSSLGYALANDFTASFALPSFRQSAMDGFAVNYHGDYKFEVIGEIQAGSDSQYKLAEGQAVRIFTGAAVPDSANVVVMQEWVTTSGTTVQVDEDKALALGANIRPVGEQLSKGDLVFPSQTVLNSASIGLMQSFGITEVEVFDIPSIAILVTGDELVTAGQDLKFGQIYESNAITLETALNERHFKVSNSYRVKDDKEEIEKTINEAISKHDVVIISGGISVGEYDFVAGALESLGVEQQFYKVNQKPGKPLFFGTLGRKLIFALPGNPAASLSCLIEYVLPGIRKMSGYNQIHPLKLRLPLANDHRNKGHRSKFLKGIVADGKVSIADGQASSMLHSFALANCLVYLPKGDEPMAIGDMVEVHLL